MSERRGRLASLGREPMSHVQDVERGTEGEQLGLALPFESPTSKASPRKRGALKAYGLFAGIGGMELGLARAGHRTAGFCEIEPTAVAVLRARFPRTPVHSDVRTLEALPKGISLLTGGCPCQDLSQAGKTAGIGGLRSGLVGQVFRLVEESSVPWVLLENVSFMLRLDRGSAMELIVSAFERMGYRGISGRGFARVRSPSTP